jgi:DNA-binding CsgD family transcriptional regulator
VTEGGHAGELERGGAVDRGGEVERVCATGTRPCPTRLRPSELEVILLITGGLTDDAVAASTHHSPHTVRNHVGAAMRRTGARSRTELVARCFAAGVFTRAWPPRIGAQRCLCGLGSHERPVSPTDASSQT